MALISDIQDFKKYVTVTVTSQATATMPNMDIADEDYLWPVLGETVYEAMLLPANNSATWLRLQELCKRVVAPMALADLLAKKQVAVSDTGIHSTNSENLVAAHRWEFLELRDSLFKDATRALEKLWQQLYDHGIDYGWENPLPRKTLFTSGLQFSQYYFISSPYVIYAALLPIIAETEDQHVYANMGKDFITALRDKTTPDSYETELLRLLHIGIANLSISTACRKLAVKISEKGFTVLMGDSGDQPYKGDQDSSYTLKQALEQRTGNDGKKYISEAIAYLNANASEAIFPDYFSSSYYVNPNAPKADDPNKNRRGVFVM
jgi:hypothetical protein